MKQTTDDDIRPRAADPQLLARLLDFQSATWPHGLYRFAPFKRKRDGDYVIYRSVCWNPYKNSLHVLKLGAEPTPKGVGNWFEWFQDAEDKPLSDIYLVEESTIPERLKGPTSTLPKSSAKGMNARTSTVQALTHVDVVGKGRAEDFVFNDLVITDSAERSNAMRYVIEKLQKVRGYQTHIRKMFHKWVHFAGIHNALANLSERQGGEKKSRVGANFKRPGPKSARENMAVLGGMRGRENTKSQRPVRPSDESKFVKALTEHWAKDKVSLRETYDRMVLESYPKWPKHLIPRRSAFEYHARTRLIEQHDLKALRKGERLSGQYDRARVGQSTYLTQGVIEIVDVDGFVAKLRVAARIGHQIKAITITVMFAVSRNSGAVVGYELAVKGENAEAFRRCIASCFLPKEERARELGITSTKGLVSANIDGIFVDNGAGASEAVLVAACDEMRLMRMLPPPGRGDYKGVGEGLNSMMVLWMLQEDGAFTRRTDHLSREVRRSKRKDKPIPLDRFERLLLLAIQQNNLYTNKKRLRTEAMRKANVGVMPTAILKYTQEQRPAAARRQFTKAEVFDRFLPWTNRVCRRGLVQFMGMRYTSDDLVEAFDEHAKKAVRSPFSVSVKRLGGEAGQLLWRQPMGPPKVLELVEEDARSIGSVTWKGLELLNLDDDWREQILIPARRKSRARMTVKQHSDIAKTEARRAASEMAGLEGVDIRAARIAAEAQRDAARAAAQAEAYNIAPSEVAANELPAEPTSHDASPAELSYLQRLKERMSNMLTDRPREH